MSVVKGNARLIFLLGALAAFGPISIDMFYGPISDHYGRRPVLISGILIFIVSSADQLVILRYFQATGGNCFGSGENNCARRV